jgi:hypothetical protein
MRRLAYHAAINSALAFGRVQDIAHFEMQNSGDGIFALPWFTASLIVWATFRPPFVLLARLAFRLADGIPVEERESLRRRRDKEPTS